MPPDPLAGKRVAVLGFARQGQALARWLPTVGARVVVSDMRPAAEISVDLSAYPGVDFVLGGHPEHLLDAVDLLCLSGGVPLNTPIVAAARARGIPLANDAQLFLERCPAPVIGITGSAGKTTTTTLIGRIMEQAGHTTWVGGNIGAVLLDVLPQIAPDDRVIMEMSSFQLEVMTVSPPLAAVLNLTPNHLDRHGDMTAYSAAKARILRHQAADDVALLGRDDPGCRTLEADVHGRLLWFSRSEIVGDGAFMAGQRLLVSGMASPDGAPHVVLERAEIPLHGAHNVSNVLAACALCGAAGIAPGVMAAAVRAFEGVPHRMEVVRVRAGVTYVDDSIATAPERVVAALRSYDEPLILLVGGRDKNLEWDEMIVLALRKARHIIAFGEVGGLVVEVARRFGGAEAVRRVATLEAAVALAASLAQRGDVVLLSPGGTSFDAYDDFAQRGAHFRQLTMAL